MTGTLPMRIAALLLTLTLIAVTLPAAVAQREGPVIRQPGPVIMQPGPILRPGPLVLRPFLGPTINFEAKLSPELLERALKLRVFRLAPPRFDEGFFEQFVDARLGGFDGERVRMGNLIAIADDRSNFAMLDTETGMISFSQGMADQIDERPGDLPDGRRARALAREFLMEAGLWPRGEKQVTSPHIGHIRSATFNPETGEESGPMLQMLTVYFGRMIDDTEVIGSASKMIVQIGDGGKVVGAGVNWREIAQAMPLSQRQLRSSDQLTSDIQNFLRREFVQGERLTVRQLGLFYYDNGGDYIQPVIGFEVKVQAGEMQPFTYFGQVPLLTNPPELVGPAPLSEEALKLLQQGSQEAAPPTEQGD